MISPSVVISFKSDKCQVFGDRIVSGVYSHLHHDDNEQGLSCGIGRFCGGSNKPNKVTRNLVDQRGS